MRTALDAWEDSSVYECGEIINRFFWRFQWITYGSFAQDHRASGSSEAFVGGGGHHLEARIQRIFQFTSGNETCYMCHIRHRNRADLASYLCKFCIIKLSGIG